MPKFEHENACDSYTRVSSSASVSSDLKALYKSVIIIIIIIIITKHARRSKYIETAN